jgi:pimeloyl-ACP methyl ester carboxylesterase
MARVGHRRAAGQLPGLGHDPMLEALTDFNAALAATLAELGLDA